MIVIVDYDMGNLGSIQNMLKKIGKSSRVSSQISDIEGAQKLILPGVGSFDRGMKRLQELNLIEPLRRKVIQHKTPILGICLGMQLMTDRSEEGTSNGLGWIKGKTIRFRFDSNQTNLKVPHMGWNTVRSVNENSLFGHYIEEPRFYFVHSYHVECEHKENEAANSFYGYDFTSAIQKDHILGVQFHPEKSHRFGMTLLKNFIEF